jgi:hypothetical protein
MHRSHVSLVSAPSQPPPNAPTSTRTPTPQREACTPALPPNAVDSATVGFADAFRLFVRDAVHQELTGLKEELLQAARNATALVFSRLRKSRSALVALRQRSANGSKRGTSPPCPSVPPAADMASDGETSKRVSPTARSGKSLWTPTRKQVTS